jgi:hypothetical protein
MERRTASGSARYFLLIRARTTTGDRARAAAADEPSACAVLAALRAALGMSLYFGALLLGRALGAAWLHRHLMV